MPADFDTGYTFGQLITELAVVVGLGEYDATTGVAKVPTDAETLRALKLRVNEGLRFMALSRPNWSMLEAEHSLTFAPAGDGPFNVDADPARYRLPHWVHGQPKGPYVYSDSASGVRALALVGQEVVRRFHATEVGSGTPTYVAVRSIDPEHLGRKRRWEAWFWPTPSHAYTVNANYRIHVLDMIELDDRHPFGAEHDVTILRCAEEAWRRHDEEDPAIWERAKVARDEALALSHRLDGRNQPRNLSRVTDPGVDYEIGPGFRRETPFTYDGVSVSE